MRQSFGASDSGAQVYPAAVGRNRCRETFGKDSGSLVFQAVVKAQLLSLTDGKPHIPEGESRHPFFFPEVENADGISAA
jgi:hypothetical protein